MELSQLGFLEELLAQPTRRDDNNNNTWCSALSTGWNELCWGFEPFHENPSLASLNPPPLAAFSSAIDHRFECPYGSNEASAAYPFVDGLTMPELDSSYTRNDDSAPFLPLEEDNHHHLPLEDEGVVAFLERNSGCKVEEEKVAEVLQGFNMGLCGAEKKPNKPKKLEGQPSKNLMAERRRRKRLNDRLSMLRSIVPKISKMDRTSILGDTIDYMKELLERIGKLQEEEMEEGTNQIKLLGISKELKPNDVAVRNSPKFDVERREKDTRISICCATKPGLLLSTVNTLEALGLEIHHCVISSFNDFSLQASCSEVVEQRNCISNEEVKQALFRNAGYGGRYVWGKM